MVVKSPDSQRRTGWSIQSCVKGLEPASDICRLGNTDRFDHVSLLATWGRLDEVDWPIDLPFLVPFRDQDVDDAYCYEATPADNDPLHEID
jgi:hypothetical protein